MKAKGVVNEQSMWGQRAFPGISLRIVSLEHPEASGTNREFLFRDSGLRLDVRLCGYLEATQQIPDLNRAHSFSLYPTAPGMRVEIKENGASVEDNPIDDVKLLPV
jgi:hypothetical protein